MSKGRKLLRVARWILLGLVLFAVLNEAAIRVAVHFKNESSFRAFVDTLPAVKPWQKVTFGALVRPSEHRKLIYQLRPNMKVTHREVKVTTNSQGWRDQEYDKTPPAKTVRVVGIGDSNMYGWGVEQGKDFLTVLEGKLNKKYGDKKRWEVINTGVPGYNTYMKAESLRSRSIAFKPDIVIIQHTINDLLLPEFVYEYPDVWSPNRSFFLDFVLGRYKLADNKLKVVFEADFKEVPERFKYMEGEEGFARAMVMLRDLREEHGFEVVLHISHDHPVGIAHGLLKLCKEFSFHCFVKLHRTDDPKLIVSKEDLHPSALGHQLLADTFFQFLEEEHLIPKALER